jgi:hypothetical protein
MFTADGYSIGTTKTTSSLQGIADTGTSLLLTDDDVVAAYYAKVKGSQNSSSQGGYIFPCSATLPDFSLIISGETRTGKPHTLDPLEEIDHTNYASSRVIYKLRSHL